MLIVNCPPRYLLILLANFYSLSPRVAALKPAPTAGCKPRACVLCSFPLGTSTKVNSNRHSAPGWRFFRFYTPLREFFLSVPLRSVRYRSEMFQRSFSY